MFEADRPILNSEQDRLGRTTFAKYLARCILDHNDPQSLVIGLYGDWGSGKTSIINLVLEELHYAANNMFDEEQPVILNFNPWSYSGQGQILESFFHRLISELQQATKLGNAKKIIQLIKLYVSFFSLEQVKNLGWNSGKDPIQVKRELNAVLTKQKHKIIIIIDNISRLEDEEIKQILQIVKSMADYANTVFMLSMEKRAVLAALDRIHNGDGTQYLEKVIQIPFEIPAISNQDLENIFLEKMQRLLNLIPEASWEKTYWADLYYLTIKYLFKNCRDVTRYINTISFGYPRVKEVVNPVDFFGICALYTFSPQVYYGVRDNKDLFTDLMDHVFELTPEKLAEDKTRCEEILRRAGRIPYEMLVQFLLRLFPRLRNIFQANTVFYHSESIARQNRRICTPDMFEIYFRLSIPSGYIPEGELKAILATLPDEEGFALALLRLNQDEKIVKFLDLLDSEIHTISGKYIKNLIQALLDSGDLFPEGQSTLLNYDVPMRIHRIIHQLLRRFEITQHRFEILSDAIKRAVNSIFIIVHELKIQGEEHVETADTFVPLEQRDFTPEQLVQLRKFAVIKIIDWAQTKRLSEHPKLIPILFAWKEWGDPAQCTEYVENLLKEDRGVVDFLLAAFKGPVDQAMSKLEKSPDWAENLKNVQAFIALDQVEKRAREIFEDQSFEKQREREQLAVLIFLDLVNPGSVKIIPKTSV